jgi:hypothetical protein
VLKLKTKGGNMNITDKVVIEEKIDILESRLKKQLKRTNEVLKYHKDISKKEYLETYYETRRDAWLVVLNMINVLKEAK